jgi:Zn finger protein HypA/HybF involved in hydrogenase expression
MKREEAIKLIDTHTVCFYNEIDSPTLQALHLAIEALSAEAVQGEWIDVENEPYCECSVCGSYIDNLDDDYAFCPRCGAKMKGGAE